MRPPGIADWKQSNAEIGGVTRGVFVTVFSQTPDAQSFVGEHWDTAYRGGGGLFIHHLPTILGEPVDFTPTGIPGYCPTELPPEVWFLPDVSFGDVWPFAKQMGFVTPKLPQAVSDACDLFLCDLASKQPIGVESVGEGMATFRRHKDGGAFDISDMRRACELNVAVLGGPQDPYSLVGWGNSTNCCGRLMSVDMNVLRRASITARAVDSRPFNLDVSTNLTTWTPFVNGFTGDLNFLEPFTGERKFYRVTEP